MYGDTYTLATCTECGTNGWCAKEGTRPSGLLVECPECLALFITSSD